MARATTAKIDDKGYLRIRVPAAVRKRLPADCEFEVKINGASMTIEPVNGGMSDDLAQRHADFDRAGRLQAWGRKKGIVPDDIRRAVKQARAQKNAKK